MEESQIIDSKVPTPESDSDKERLKLNQQISFESEYIISSPNPMSYAAMKGQEKRELPSRSRDCMNL
jgi:hypothetical protein